MVPHATCSELPSRSAATRRPGYSRGNNQHLHHPVNRVRCLYSARHELTVVTVEDRVRACADVPQSQEQRMTAKLRAFLPMSMNVHFLAGSWQTGVNRCLCLSTDVTSNARKPLKQSGLGGSRTRERGFDSPRLHSTESRKSGSLHLALHLLCWLHVVQDDKREPPIPKNSGTTNGEPPRVGIRQQGTKPQRVVTDDDGQPVIDLPYYVAWHKATGTFYVGGSKPQAYLRRRDRLHHSVRRAPRRRCSTSWREDGARRPPRSCWRSGCPPASRGQRRP